MTSFATFKLLVFILLLAYVVSSESIFHRNNDNIIDDKSNSIKEIGGSKILIQLISNAFRLLNIRKVVNDVQDGRWTSDACLPCKFAISMAQHLIEFGKGKEDIADIAKTLCKTFDIESSGICDGVVDQFKNDLAYIRLYTKLETSEMCGVIFGVQCVQNITKNLNWTIDIPDKPKYLNKEKNSETVGLLKMTKKHSSVIHVTDVHVDQYYTQGTNTDCGEPLCCRASNGLAATPEKAAGIWGDYRNCDTPVKTIENALNHISTAHSDAIYWMWTGDIAPHDIWNVTRKEVLLQIRLVTNLIKQYSVGLPVYPVIGNHEGVPVNSFPPPEVISSEFSISWLYDFLANEWSYWLPEDAIKTLRYGGYYTVKARPGLRIISINTNYCARLNPWLLLNPIDPANQLQWLTKVLFKAELNKEKVHIIGHSPPDSRDCTQAWLHNFLRIVDRFQDTILAQYYGHTHRDEFRVFYSPYDQEVPIGSAYIGPSLTPWTENNPSYRIYDMDSDGYLLDHQTFYFNLTEANQGTAGPNWKLEYKAVNTFNLTTMSAHGWHQLLNQLQRNDSMLQFYYKLYYRQSDIKKDERCDSKCKNFLISDLKVRNAFESVPKPFDWY